MRLFYRRVKAVDPHERAPYAPDMTQPSSTAEDQHHIAQAWRRFRRILLAMAGVAMICALLMVALLWTVNGPLPWIFIGLTIFGVWGTIMMAALLMGLIFVSNSTGHDQSVDDRGNEAAPVKQDED